MEENDGGDVREEEKDPDVRVNEQIAVGSVGRDEGERDVNVNEMREREGRGRRERGEGERERERVNRRGERESDKESTQTPSYHVEGGGVILVKSKSRARINRVERACSSLFFAFSILLDKNYPLHSPPFHRLPRSPPLSRTRAQNTQASSHLSSTLTSLGRLSLFAAQPTRPKCL